MNFFYEHDEIAFFISMLKVLFLKDVVSLKNKY